MNIYSYRLIILLIYSVYSNFYSNPTYSKLVLSNANGTSLKISPQQNLIAAGFSDGTVKILDLSLNQICSSSSNNSPDILQIIWLPSFGPVTLDVDNTITLWQPSTCAITNSLSFNQTIIRINFNQVTDDNGTTIAYVALNFQNRIQQYNIQTGDLNLEYLIPTGQNCLQVIYNPDGQNTVLLASSDSSIVRKFQTENGTQVQDYIVESPLQQMVKISVVTGDVVMGIATNNDIIRIDSSGQVLDRGYYQQANSITICPATKQFALAYATTKRVGIYLYAGNQQQVISTLNGFPQDLDCSTSYLVIIDDLGYINVYTYEQFKTWIIGLIAGIGGGLLALVIGVIVFIKLKKKFSTQATQQAYKTNKKPKKYPKNKQKSGNKQQSMKMLKVSTLETTMRE